MKVENTAFYIGESVTGTSNREQGSKIEQSKSSINGSTFAAQNDPIAAKREGYDEQVGTR